MKTTQGWLEAAWSGWSESLVSTLFPNGLGVGQHFAFGQTTLIVDFANSDPEIANAEIFRIGDTEEQLQYAREDTNAAACRCPSAWSGWARLTATVNVLAAV